MRLILVMESDAIESARPLDLNFFGASQLVLVTTCHLMTFVSVVHHGQLRDLSGYQMAISNPYWGFWWPSVGALIAVVAACWLLGTRRYGFALGVCALSLWLMIRGLHQADDWLSSHDQGFVMQSTAVGLAQGHLIFAIGYCLWRLWRPQQEAKIALPQKV